MTAPSSADASVPGTHWAFATLFWVAAGWRDFGPVVGAAKTIARRLVYGAALVHCLEAVLAAFLARRRGLAAGPWFLRGLYLGVFAWTRLLR